MRRGSQSEIRFALRASGTESEVFKDANTVRTFCAFGWK